MPTFCFYTCLSFFYLFPKQVLNPLNCSIHSPWTRQTSVMSSQLKAFYTFMFFLVFWCWYLVFSHSNWTRCCYFCCIAKHSILLTALNYFGLFNCDSFSDQLLVLTFIPLIMVSLEQYSAITVLKYFRKDIWRATAVSLQLSGNSIAYVSMRLFVWLRVKITGSESILFYMFITPTGALSIGLNDKKM